MQNDGSSSYLLTFFKNTFQSAHLSVFAQSQLRFLIQKWILLMGAFNFWFKLTLILFVCKSSREHLMTNALGFCRSGQQRKSLNPFFIFSVCPLLLETEPHITYNYCHQRSVHLSNISIAKHHFRLPSSYFYFYKWDNH